MCRGPCVPLFLRGPPWKFGFPSVSLPHTEIFSFEGDPLLSLNLCVCALESRMSFRATMRASLPRRWALTDCVSTHRNPCAVLTQSCPRPVSSLKQKSPAAGVAFRRRAVSLRPPVTPRGSSAFLVGPTVENRPVTAAHPLVWGPRLPRSGPGCAFPAAMAQGCRAGPCVPQQEGPAPAGVCVSAVPVHWSAPADRPPLPRAQLSPCPAQGWHVARAWWMSRERGKVVRRREAHTLHPYGRRSVG